MAHRTSSKKSKAAKSESAASSELIDQELLNHLAALGLGTASDYQYWCSLNGFSRRLDKDWRQRMRERTHAARAVTEARLAQARAEKRKPEKIIAGIFQGHIQPSDLQQPQFAAIGRALKSLAHRTHAFRAAQRLLIHVCRTTELLSAAPVVAEYGVQAGNSFVEALIALAVHGSAWVREPEDWQPRTHNVRRQFASLARHLFAKWSVPAFMDSVWFRGYGDVAFERQRWFIHVGQGQSIRTAALPLPFTKRMAHHFMLAPADLSVEGALRWGQILALGGGERLARAVITTRLSNSFEAEDFWSTVLEWLVAHPMLDPTHVGPIVDFLQHQKFVPQHRIRFVPQPGAPGAADDGPALPPQPHLTMKGRTPDSLLKQVAAWHQKLSKTEQPAAEWWPSGIKAFEFIEGTSADSLKVWTITELLSTKALFAEGRAMKHCVASYARSCAAGACSIWTLEVETSEEPRRRVLTVEVNNRTRVICQARGKCNVMPGEKHRGILRRWAGQNGLQVAAYV